MAISYSYPMGTPKLTDTVLGVQYEEMKDPAVKNFSIDDIVVLAAAEITPTPGPTGPQGVQGIQGIQGQMASKDRRVQGIQGIPGTSATQTLQQTVDLGNTISGIAGGVTFTTTLTNTSVKVGASTISGMTLNTTQLISEKNSGSDLMVLQFPSVYSGVNQITLPAATGTVALNK
jgi:hypothetical protein